MNKSKTILLVEDHPITREMLKNILLTSYSVIEASNGKKALKILKANPDQILAVLCDIQMPEMNGFQFLNAVNLDDKFENLPIIMMTGSDDVDDEIKALQQGARDFVSAPYNGEVILRRLQNVIAGSALASIEHMRRLTEHDPLTGLYNKPAFFRYTEAMIGNNREKQFVFAYFYLERFQLINTVYGAAEGNKLIKYVSEMLINLAENDDNFFYGSMDADVFCFCMEYDEAKLEKRILDMKRILGEFGGAYDTELIFGLYIIKDNEMPLETIYSKANMAAKVGASNFIDHYTYYTDEMDRQLKKEQEILNDMHSALENKEFQVYLQPKCNIHNNTIVGAEALVRWVHPVKGIISPGEFIPLFEKNGFITKLDYYMWEETCKILRRWLDKGLDPKPISVNVSQINVYNPKLTETILSLVDRYELPHELFELEITESSYAFNSATLIKIVEELRENHFTISMDDFGNGYSSLNILKDIHIDVLKLDMQFMANTRDSGRGENIVASIIRMAKWLKIPVVVEGVETIRQVEFLKSVGCDYVQGFYFARPMPVVAYEERLKTNDTFNETIKKSDHDDFDMDLLFQSNPQMSAFFGDMLQALIIFEFDGENVEMIRANEGYFDIFGSSGAVGEMWQPVDAVDHQYKEIVKDAFTQVTNSKGTSECELIRNTGDGTTKWVALKLRYIQSMGKKHMIMGLLNDITAQKMIDFELGKYRKAVISARNEEKIMLLVDDVEANRTMLKKIFASQYRIIEADNGQTALERLKDEPGISVILLDIIMPVMDGWSFLQHRKNSAELSEIPVIIISAKNNLDEQENALEMGVNDYIVKPFVPEAVRKRVSNVMDSITLFREEVRKYDFTGGRLNPDAVTGLYEKTTAITLIQEYLEDFADDMNVMILLQMEEFNKWNELYVEVYDESLIKKLGKILKDLFRQNDISFRYDENIFGVFAKDFKDLKKLDSRLNQLGRLLMSDNQKDGLNITFNIGAAFTPKYGHSYGELLEKVETALKTSEDAGENHYLIYGEEGKTLK